MFLNTETNEFPRYIGDIQLLFPEWKEGDALPDPWVEVEYTEEPLPEEGFVLDGAIPELSDDGIWRLSWKFREVTEEEMSNSAINRIPQPYPSWIFDIDLNEWKAPVNPPLDGGSYIWSEKDLSWLAEQ